MQIAPLVVAFALHAVVVGVAVSVRTAVAEQPDGPAFEIRIAHREVLEPAVLAASIEPQDLTARFPLEPLTAQSLPLPLFRDHEAIPTGVESTPPLPATSLDRVSRREVAWHEAVISPRRWIEPAVATAAPAPAEGATVEAMEIDEQNVPPEYPARARRLGQEGTVIVELAIDAEGRVTEVSLHRSSGSELLDRAALGALRSWRYRPAQARGVAVASRVRVPVVFDLTAKVRGG